MSEYTNLPKSEDVEILESEIYIPRGISLRTINKWLRKIGLLLVVEARSKQTLASMPPEFSHTRFWIEKPLDMKAAELKRRAA